MSRYTKEDIFRIVEEEDVEFIRLQFTDIFGTLKNVAITSSQLEKALNNKCMFDGSSIEGFVRIEESDMYLYPDLDTFTIFPWRPQQGKVARIICDIYCADKTPFTGDSRYITKENKNLYVTEIGSVVNSIMKESFPTIVDEHFTANMESLLDSVAEGHLNWKTVVANFYPDLLIERTRQSFIEGMKKAAGR